MISPHNKHGYAGVIEMRGQNRFKARLIHNGVRHVRYAKTAEEAGALVDAMARDLGIYEKLYKELNGVYPPDYVKEVKQPRPNSYGFPGVGFDYKKNRFRSRVRRNGKTFKRYSKTLEEAIEKQKYLNEKYAKPKKVKQRVEVWDSSSSSKRIYTDEELTAHNKELQRRTYLKNREDNLRKRKEARALDPEGFSKRTREWYANSPDARNKAVAQAAKRRAEKISATPPWASNVGKVYAEMRAIAKELESLTKIVYNVDHVVPLLAGTTTMHKMRLACGLHCEDNLELITKEENLSKQHLTWPDMWDYTDEHLVELKVLYERHTT
jgi:hypothetical protein